MLTALFVYLCRFAPLKRNLWRGWYQFLARHYEAPDWTFMNYGYAAIPEFRGRTRDFSNWYCGELYRFVASDVDLRGLNVLEVGSGRGGGASFIKRELGPATMTGVDFSENAVRFCRRMHRMDGLDFIKGDAEALPFEDESFDAVINVESSHCYGSMKAFLSQVRRVLRPGGYFLHADLRDRDGAARWREQLQRSGMAITREIDITRNVLAALDADNERKSTLISKLIPPSLHAAFAGFAALRGSVIYDGFLTGAFVYRCYTLQKRREP